MSDPLPRTGRLAGVDYGTVRIGIAITDPAQSLASPLEILTRRDQAQDERYFRRLAEQERLVGFVVGLPVHTSGLESQKSIEARTFAKWLGEITKLPVVLFDERYSTAQAESLLQDAGLTSKRRKQRRDMLAAQILLAAYLESNRKLRAARSVRGQGVATQPEVNDFRVRCGNPWAVETRRQFAFGCLGSKRHDAQVPDSSHRPP